MSAADVIEKITRAIENRVAAIGTEAEQLLTEGEAEYAKLKTAFAAELAKLAEEIKSLVS